jgi:hypothetical protein
MKLYEITDLDEPLTIGIIRKALEDGKPVWVNYKGDGGQLISVEHRKQETNFSFGGGAVGYLGSFRLPDKVLDTLELRPITRIIDGKPTKTLALREPHMFEARNISRDWIDKADREFRQIIKDAGWQLRKPVRYGLDAGYFGGNIFAGRSISNEVLSYHDQQAMLMKMLAKKLIEYAKAGQIVTHGPSYEDYSVGKYDTVDDLAFKMATSLYSVRLDGRAFDHFWKVSVPADIVARNTNKVFYEDA